MLIFIDAYNVLQYIAKGKAGAQEKEWFVQRLADHAQASAHEMFLVFDGGSVMVPARERFGKLTVIHTGHTESADDYIIRLLEKNSGKPMVVVSSDHQIRSAARRWGAKSMEAAQFAQVIAEPEVEKSEPTSKRGKQLRKRAGSTDNDELAKILEQESRRVLIKDGKKS